MKDGLTNEQATKIKEIAKNAMKYIDNEVKTLKFDSGGISRCCARINKTHKGFIWEFDK